MVNAHVFDYINVLDKAADAAWIRNEAIGNNISNATTPGYKRQDVAFESELKKALHSAKYGGTRRLDTTMDHGNNVDPDTEGVYLAENQLRYQGLIQSINDEFSNLKMVMK